jgi:hypothetical protein
LREDTVDLAVGIGRVRWRDDREAVLRQYPGAGLARPRVGVDPATGRRISVPAGLLIEPFLESGSLPLGATVRFGPEGVSEVSLSPRFEEVPDIPALIAQVGELCRRLGVGPVDPEETTLAWRRGEVEVELALGHDDFSITISAGRAADAEARSSEQ